MSQWRRAVIVRWLALVLLLLIWVGLPSPHHPHFFHTTNKPSLSKNKTQKPTTRRTLRRIRLSSPKSKGRLAVPQWRGEGQIPFSLRLKHRQALYRRFFEEARSFALGAAEDRFLKIFKKHRLAEAYQRPHSPQSVSLAARRYLRLRGLRNYRLLGYRTLQQFEEKLRRYVRAGGFLLHGPLANKEKRLGELAADVAQYGGNYPLIFRQIGLPGGSRSLSSPPLLFWLRTLFLARWARDLWGALPLPAILGEVVYRDYLKARILWARSARSRLWSVKELGQRDRLFPYQRTWGWLLLQLGKKEKARQALQRALQQNPYDKQSAFWLKQLKTK